MTEEDKNLSGQRDLIKSEIPLKDIPTETLLDELLERVSTEKGLTNISNADLQDLASDLEQIADGLKAIYSQRSKEQAPQDWLNRVKKNALIIHRHGKIFPEKGMGFADDVTQFPNPEKLSPFQTSIFGISFHHTALFEAATSKLDPSHKKTSARDFYPILYINPSHTLKREGKPVGQFVSMLYTYEQVEANPLDPHRKGPVDFYLCFTQDFGNEFSQALLNGSVDPNIFLNLYDSYFPPVNPQTGTPRPKYQDVSGGKELTIIKGDLNSYMRNNNWHSDVSNLAFSQIPFSKI